MKIGILTLTPKNNYGGILQAVALCGHLEKHGHDVVLINKNRFKKSVLIRMAVGFIERLPFQNIKNKRKDYLKTKQLKPFLDKNLPQKTKEIVSSLDLKKLVENEGFDAVIVGSDQVWRYQYIGDGHHNVFFLDFDTAKPVKKIAYAASFGKDEWEAPEHIAQISHLLSNFDAISTREKSGVKLCKNTFGVPGVMNVLDPTLLVGADFYDRFFSKLKERPPQKTIATYILDRNKDKEAIVNAVIACLEPAFCTLQQVNLSEQKNEGFYSVEEWMWNIKNAEFIVTDSFHGMVFSIIFEKQFVVVGNEKRGLSRFTDLLNEIGLSERLVLGTEIDPILIKEKINYSDKNKILAAMRNYSINFLHNSMNC